MSPMLNFLLKEDRILGQCLMLDTDLRCDHTLPHTIHEVTTSNRNAPRSPNCVVIWWSLDV